MAPACELAIAAIVDGDVDDVIALWRACGLTRPWNDPAADIALARRDGNSTILTGREGSAMVATVMVGHDGHRGWVYYLAVDPDRRRKGYGRVLMQAGERWLHERRIGKLQLMVRPDNAVVSGFYRSLGYSMQKRIVYAKWLDGREATP